MQAGGDGELTAAVNLAGRSGDFMETNSNPAAQMVPLKRFNNFQATLKDGGKPVATVTQFILTIDNALDTSVPSVHAGCSTTSPKASCPSWAA